MPNSKFFVQGARRSTLHAIGPCAINLSVSTPRPVRRPFCSSLFLVLLLATQVAPEGFSPVQSVIWRSRPDGAEEESGDTATIPTPDQCDHSAVPLPSWGASANSDVGYWARKRRR